MKIIYVVGFMMIILASIVAAGTQVVIDPYNVEMGQNDIKNVSVCITKTLHGHPIPQAGVDLFVTTPNASFSVKPVVSPTGGDGCGIIEVETVDAESGVYTYEVNGKISGNLIVAEEGSAFTVPEFSGIAALLALAGAFTVYFRKRK